MKTELITTLVQVQNEISVPKNQRNEFGGFNYRSAEDILVAAKPILSKYGLLLTLTDELVYQGDRYYVKATASLTDGEDTFTTTALARECDERKGMDEAQITGMASSYARKYALNGLFCLDDVKDADSLNNSEEPANTAQKTTFSITDLKKFCRAQTDAGNDYGVTKKFYSFYEGKLASWTGKFDADRLYERWMKNNATS